MKVLHVPCPCGKKVQIILQGEQVFVAHHEATKTAPKKKIRANGGDAEPLPCKECGRVFFRAASLGVHRLRAHGVKGKSTKKGGK